MDQPEWMMLAWQAYGETEIQGPRDNRQIMKYFADVGQGGIRHDEVAWCAAFVGSCLERAGVKSTRSLMARSYLTWGKKIDTPRSGAIAVLRRGRSNKLGHVGFVVRATAKTLYLLGGNQSDQVKVSKYARSRLLGFRWPADEQHAVHAEMPGGAAILQPANERAERDDSHFERALAHVLKMEGGYDDDPHDPGGATNYGITIGEYARERGVQLSPKNVARLKRQLRRISPDTVR